MGRIIEFQGRKIQVPDNATDADIQSALGASAKNPDGTYGQPPADAIVHDYGGKSYIAGNPAISTTVDPGASERDQYVAFEALKRRGDVANETGDGDFFPEWQRRAMPFTQGFSFNSSDEILSNLVAAIMNPGIFATGGAMPSDPETAKAFSEQANKYSDTRDVLQEIQEQTLDRQREEYPVQTALTNIAGGVTSGYGLAKNGVTLVGNMANNGLRNLLPRMFAGGLEGATYGGISGYFGADGGNDERFAQAAENAPLGAVVGAAAVPAVDLISAIMKPVANAWNSWRNPEGTATEKLAEAMAMDATSADDIATRMKQAILDGVPEYKMVDAAGKNAQRVGAIAAKTPSGFRAEVADTMAARQMNQGDRIAGYMDDALGQGDDAFRSEQALIAARQNAAKPLYEKAYSAPTPQGQIYDEMLGKQSVKDAMSAVRRVAEENQIPITDLLTEIPNPNPQMQTVVSDILDASGKPITRSEAVQDTLTVPTVRGWDFIKRELDAKVNQLFKAGDTTAATAIKETRNQLRQALSESVPDYAAALKSYSDDSASLEAMEAGRNLISARNPDEAKAIVSQIDPSNKSLAKLGAAREAGVKLDNMRSGQDKTLMFDTPNMQGKLETIVDDPVALAVLREQLGLEKDMVRSSRTMLNGSSTAENLIDEATLNNNGGAMAALLSGQPLRALGLAAGTAMGKIGRATSGISEKGANAIGEFLLSSDPEKVRGLAELYQQMLARQTAPSITPAVIDAGFNSARTGTEKR